MCGGEVERGVVVGVEKMVVIKKKEEDKMVRMEGWMDGRMDGWMDE